MWNDPERSDEHDFGAILPTIIERLAPQLESFAFDDRSFHVETTTEVPWALFGQITNITIALCFVDLKVNLLSLLKLPSSTLKTLQLIFSCSLYSNSHVTALDTIDQMLDGNPKALNLLCNIVWFNAHLRDEDDDKSRRRRVTDLREEVTTRLEKRGGRFSVVEVEGGDGWEQWVAAIQ